MITIKFSHRYTKHPINVIDGSEVRLIEVLKSKFEDLSDTFKEYDTKLCCGGNYALPKKGDCLVGNYFLNFDDDKLSKIIEDKDL